ncbi:hypothetical protein [Streptosporangium sp. KLBMP 9127]|nr:hypothetical protein [Streptosporangium sp. KLBMP 9127]
MSPKSRGRPAGRGRPKRPQRAVARLRLSEQILLDARRISQVDDVLPAELWASEWLGEVRQAAPPGETEAEHLVCTEVAGRATAGPTPLGMAAVAALLRVAPESERRMLTEAAAILSISQPAPPWAQAPAWVPTGAWRAVDVWESERVLLVEYGSHTLMAVIHDDGGTSLARLDVLDPGAASRWEEFRASGDVPMPLRPAEPSEVLAELAGALRETDLAPPRAEESLIALRALAWSRSRDRLPGWPDWSPLPADDRQRLIDDFAGDDPVDRALAGLFLDYGDARFAPGALAWSPGRVAIFLGDRLPAGATLEPEQRDRLPGALRRWVRFALERRGVAAEWIEPVETAVDTYLPAWSR